MKSKYDQSAMNNLQNPMYRLKKLPFWYQSAECVYCIWYMHHKNMYYYDTWVPK